MACLEWNSTLNDGDSSAESLKASGKLYPELQLIATSQDQKQACGEN